MLIVIIIFVTSLLLLSIAEIVSIIAADTKARKRDRIPIEPGLVSVILPVHNEEAVLHQALAAIEEQSDDNYELILIIDRCTDASLKTAEDFALNADFNIKILSNNQELPPGNSPKAFLLEKGIAESKGEIFLFTDADCIPPSDWITDYRRLFADAKVGLGTGSVETSPVNSIFTAYQNFEHLYRSFYAAACIGAGVPTGAFGNNLGIRRSCYDSLGGFSNLPSSVTEDAVLVSAVRDSSWEVAVLPTAASNVVSKPQAYVKDYLSQSLRWAHGAVRSNDLKTAVYYNLLMIALTACNVSLLLSLIFPFLCLITVAGVIYLLVTSSIAGLFLKASKKFWIYIIPSVILFFFFYQVSFIRSLLSCRITWKNNIITESKM